MKDNYHFIDPNTLHSSKKRIKIRSTECNILKELWTPNLFRLLLKDSTNLSLQDNELRYSEIGIPVWSNSWFVYNELPSLEENPTDERKSRGKSKRKQTTEFTFEDVAADLGVNWLDPHVLISPENYGKSSISGISCMTQPFQVYVHPQVQLLCDLHSHLCDAEIIGFLAGKYDHNTKILYIQACFPCNSLERTEDNGATDVEMDPIAELSVREVISKYDLDVVGWYHSHPLFRPDPSTTDILNQYQYQQLFKHQSYDSEPFVGLIVSTCDPHLPSFESRHQWFHTIPMMSEKSSTSSPPISKRASKRKKMENETASPAQLYLPMKVEIRVAHVKADRDFSPTTTPDISLLLQEKLLALTHKDIQELEAQLDDDCIFVQTLSCPSNIQRGNLVGDTKCDGHDNDIDLNGNHSLNDSAEVNRGPRKFRPKFRTTESLLTIRQPERMTRSCLKKLNNPSMNESSPRSKTLPEVSDDMTEDSSKKEFDANPTPESFSTNVLVVPAPNTIDSSYPSIDLSESKSERSTPYSKRIRKDSIKKSTDATRLISRRGAQKSTPTESTLKSKETTISHSPVEINTLTLHFFQYFQIADMSASALARSFLCSSPLLLRYTSLCAIALGFYYCSYHRRTNISKKFKADYKYTKIKYSLKVWIRYFGMNDEEQEEYLDNLITFLKYCWLGV